jgi:dephospho-CoA kinase
MSRIIGLTTHVAAVHGRGRLAEHGGLVIDADSLAHLVTGPGRPTLAPIRERFGDAVFGDRGALDRAALAAVVFDDPSALRDLEAIVHPAVRLEVVSRLGSSEAQAAPFVVIEAIRLVEGGLASRCDEIWLVVCDRPTQRERLRLRGMDPDDVERRISAQGEMAERLAPAATRILRTDGSLDAAMAATDEALWAALG